MGRKKKVIDKETKEWTEAPLEKALKEKFPKRIFIPESGWSPGLNKSISAGYIHIQNARDFEAVKHLIGEDKSIFRGEQI